MAIDTGRSTEWRDLAHRVEARPWFHDGWLSAWWRAFGHGEPRVFRVRDAGRLAGVLALATDRLGLVGQANWHSPEFGMLAEGAWAREALAAAAFDERPARLRVPLLAREGTGLDELRDEAERRGYRIVERVHARSPYIPLDGTYEEFMTRVKSSHRKDLERKWRRLDDQGGLEIELFEGGSGLDAALAEGLPIEGSGWKSERGTEIVCDPALVRFYTEVAHWASAERMLLLGFMRLAGRPVSFEFMLRDERRVYGLKVGYDPEFAKWSPGMLASLAIWRRLFEDHDFETYELCGDLDATKSRWSDVTRDRVLFQAFAPTPLGRAAHAAEVHARSLALRVRSALRR
jgi:CelD/BcsL family acetyltransferase involved in cellulose biosynthesis